jgi:uncharacterized damage-inducible protein DinB
MVDEIERRQKVEAFGNAYYELSEALRQIPREAWHFKPSSNHWSIQEIIAHLADSEANGYLRFRKGIAESGKAIMTYDQVAWSNCLGYSNQNSEDLLELFRWLRSTTYNLIRGLPDSDWQNTIFHPERGVMTLDNLLDLNTSHVQRHISQMKRNFDEWRHQYQES